MNAVDISDHLRSNMRSGHRQRRGPARALTWSFLLAVALSNSFKLQQLGQPDWKPYASQSRFQQALVDEIFKIYGKTGSSRKRYRAGDEHTPIEQHNHVRTRKRSNCLACQGIQIGPRSQSSQHPRKRRQNPAPLATLDANSINSRPKGTMTPYRCDVCDVALCNRSECRYFYYRPIY